MLAKSYYEMLRIPTKYNISVPIYREDIVDMWIDTLNDPLYPNTIKVIEKNSFIPKYYEIKNVTLKTLMFVSNIYLKETKKTDILYSVLKDLLTINNIKVSNMEDNDLREVFGLLKATLERLMNIKPPLNSVYRNLMRYMENFPEIPKIVIKKMNTNLMVYIKANRRYLGRYFNLLLDARLLKDYRECEKHGAGWGDKK